jgi:hypothetical protein
MDRIQDLPAPEEASEKDRQIALADCVSQKALSCC